jgi:hypothetical protein
MKVEVIRIKVFFKRGWIKRTEAVHIRGQDTWDLSSLLDIKGRIKVKKAVLLQRAGYRIYNTSM